MTITLQNISKRYNYHWIFRNIDFVFETGKKYALTGPNGSGKSTLLRILSGNLSPSEGKIVFSDTLKNIPSDEVYQYVSYSAPYLELIEDFTLSEAIQFHFRFKKLQQGIRMEDVADILELNLHVKKFLKDFSSGMKQRVKLGFAVLSDTPIMLLDEPSTNLDRNSVEWYLNLVKKYTTERLLVIASNMQREYAFCDTEIDIETYKCS
ncbi:MAG: ATP-binding cassette domain-containing protein [Chitinophagales bacterium]